MNLETFKEALCDLMERKDHWAWPHFTDGSVPVERLHVHLEQEYAVYIRDFAWLLGRALAQCPLVEVRKELAENIYEEECGGLSLGIPHAELFLRIPAGLGMDVGRFHDVTLLPRAGRYRDFLDDATLREGWDVAVAVTTIFIEGTKWDRGELDPTRPKRPAPPLDQHPLVRNYGIPLEALTLSKVHRDVEGGHRDAAWRMVLGHVPRLRRRAVVRAMEQCLSHWLAYRDEVAEACGVARPDAARSPLRRIA